MSGMPVVVGGSRGPTGAPGSVWRDGTGAPSNNLGVNGDYYLDDITANVYLRTGGIYSVVANIKGATGATGSMGPQGPQGPQGPVGSTGLQGPQGPAGSGSGGSGSVWRDGVGAPSNGLGADGDYYLNDTTGDVYKRTTGTYAIVANIKGATGATGPQGTAGAVGAQGPQGTTGTTGATGPAGATGSTGPTGAAGAAGATGATGPAGAAGAVWRDGAGVPSNSLGLNGDYYLNDTTGDVYLRSSGTYAIVANIKGATGATGTTGAAGTPGSVWRNAAGAPSNALGVNGDYYLNNTTGDVYTRSAGTYSIVANIKGATGSTGSTGPTGAAGAAGATGATGPAGTNGTNGTVWRDGTGAPSNALGVNGDYYLNDSTGDVYLRTAGTYSIVANIKGAAGAGGSTEIDGDAYFSNNYNPTVYLDEVGGDDSNDGLTAGTAWKTFDYCINFLRSVVFKLDSGTININMAPGNYTNNCTSNGLPPLTAFLTVFVAGTGAAVTDVTLDTYYGLGFVANAWSFYNLTHTGFEGYFGAVAAVGTSSVTIYGCRFVLPSNITNVFTSNQSAQLSISPNNVYVLSSSVNFLAATENSNVSLNGDQTIQGTSSFTVFALVSDTATFIRNSGVFIVTSPTGKRYEISGLARCFVDGGGATFFPGDTSGSSTSTGTYVS